MSIERKTNVGLVLEGGAMRGMFTAGIIDVMLENNIVFDGVVGVSAGSAFGCNYKSKQIGRAVRYNKNYCNDKRYVSWRSWLKTGNLYNVDFAYYKLVDELDVFDRGTFKTNPVEFYVTCTDVETGLPVYHKCTDGSNTDIEWMRASASMPLVSKIVCIDDYKLLDGGVTDSIPLKFFQNQGYKKNVVVLTQPENYQKGKNKIIPLAKIYLRKYPKFIEAMKNRHIIYNETLLYIKEQEEKGDILVIRPPFKLNIGKIEHNPEILEEIYQVGRTTANEYLSRIKAFIDN